MGTPVESSGRDINDGMGGRGIVQIKLNYCVAEKTNGKEEVSHLMVASTY